MNKTSRNYFLLAIILFIVSFFYCKDGRGQLTGNGYWGSGVDMLIPKGKLFNATVYNPTTNPIMSFPDSIPKVQYFLKLPYSQDQFRKKIDTIYQVTMQIGKSMTVDQSEQLKGFVLSVIGRFSNDAKIDSVKTK